ncbi:putative RNase H [Trypanosoma cruzi]|uniref:Putative RNase H n=1 Tax=Trypanosoma cruzi TaxID=5693 RepID=A0A2V2XLR8_TRYCR|nr:putative RNase H [Trypanosoma cruzi]
MLSRQILMWPSSSGQGSCERHRHGRYQRSDRCETVVQFCPTVCRQTASPPRTGHGVEPSREVKSPWSPSCSQQRPAAEFLYATKAQHRDKVQHHRWGPWILTKNSGVGIPTSAGIGILLSSLHSSEIIEKVSTNGGTRPCSRTTESRALLPAMERLSVHRIQHRQKPCLWLQTVSPF